MKKLVLLLCLGLTACEAFDHPRYVSDWERACGRSFIKEDEIVFVDTPSGPQRMRKIVCLSYGGTQRTHYIKWDK